MNAIVVAVVLMLALSIMRVHVVISLFIGAIVGGLWAGMPLLDVIGAYKDGLSGGASIALSYALLGVFAVSLIQSGLPKAASGWLIHKMNDNQSGLKPRAVLLSLVAVILVTGILVETLVPIHIAFIFMMIPPLIAVFNRLNMDRRLMACVISFGLVTGYMMFPWGFGAIYLNEILLSNAARAGVDTTGVSVMRAMLIPGAGMLVGVLFAVFVSYRKPRHYSDKPASATLDDGPAQVSRYRIIIAIIAIFAVFLVQMKTESMLISALVGILVFMISGVVHFKKSEKIFDQGMQMMAMIGFIMISAQGFAAVMSASGQIEPLVNASAEIFAGSKGMAVFAMLLVGLLVTMGIGSSFSTIPIIAAIYVPLCLGMGFSPMATIAIIGTAGALGDTGSPASDSTLGPTAGLNVDGQHDHIRDTVIPTFLHFNLPLLVAGWIAAMVL